MAFAAHRSSFPQFPPLGHAVLDPAAKLMGAFHSRLRDGTAPAHSLALARREVLEEGFVHPFGWGGFVLYGAN